MTRADGTRSRTAASAPSIASATSGNDNLGSSSTFAPTSSSSGPRCMVRKWMSWRTPDAEPSAASMAAVSSRLAASPNSRLRISEPTTTAMTPSRSPMARLPPAADLVGLVDRGPQRERLEHHRDPEHGERPDRRLQPVGVAELLVALVEGEQRAEGEQHDRDQEGP